MTETEIPMEKQPDFLLTINFPSGLKNPQRIFTAASECIAALQECDAMLLKSFPSSIRPVFVLEQVENGSLRIWLKQFLESIDDDALKNLDWKPAIGKYLVKGKYLLLKKLEGRKSLPEPLVLKQLSGELHELAKETDVLNMPAYSRIPEIELARQAQKISTALSRLEPGEHFALSGDDGEAVIDAEFRVTDNDIESLMVETTLENTTELFLMVRKPDFLGESKWDFRFNKRPLSVSIADKEWLSSFQAGEIDIRPGDALHVKMMEKVLYDSTGEVVSEEQTIIEVKDVIHKKTYKQLQLTEE